MNTVFILDNAGDVSAQTMSLPEFSSFLCGSLLQDALFSSYFDDAAKAQAQTMDALVQLAVSGQGLPPDQMAQTLGMDAESVSKLYSLYFSTDPAFQQEAAAMTMTLTDFLPLLKANAPAEQQAQLAQTEQLVNLAVSGQALDAETMAGVTGMTTENVAGLYLMSGTEAMTLPDFLSAALTQAPDNADLQQMNQLVQLAVSGQALDASSLASVFDGYRAGLPNIRSCAGRAENGGSCRFLRISRQLRADERGLRRSFFPRSRRYSFAGWIPSRSSRFPAHRLTPGRWHSCSTRTRIRSRWHSACTSAGISAKKQCR